jgi:hypothetical protein
MRRAMPLLAVAIAACTLTAVATGAQTTAPGSCFAKLGGKIVSIVCPAKIKLASLVSNAAGAARTNPYPLGQTVLLPTGTWKFQFQAANTNAWSVISAFSAKNTAPPAGTVDVLVTLTATYFGYEGGAGGFGGGFTDFTNLKAVGTVHNVSYVWNKPGCGTIPNDLGSGSSLTAGAIVTGNLCFQVPADDAASLELLWDGGTSKGPFFALH